MSVKLKSRAVHKHSKSKSARCGRQRFSAYRRKLGVESLEDRRLLSTTILSASLDTDPGWSRTGQWAFGHPLGGGGASHGYPDPNSGYTGENVYGVNLSGDYDPSLHGLYHLTTSTINCANYTNINLAFRRWLNTDYQSYATTTVEVSSDQINWNTVFINSPSTPITDSSWQPMQYDLSTYANNKAAVYLRWGYQVYSGAYAYSGWNIDDIVVTGDPPPPGITCNAHVGPDDDRRRRNRNFHRRLEQPPHRRCNHRPHFERHQRRHGLARKRDVQFRAIGPRRRP